MNAAQAIQNAIAIGNANDFSTTRAGGSESIAIGRGAHSHEERAISIGYQAQGYGSDSIRIGTDFDESKLNPSDRLDPQMSTNHHNTVAIGQRVYTSGKRAVAMGSVIGNVAENAIAIGHKANAAVVNSVAIGVSANASADNSVAIGRGAQALSSNTIVLGTADDTVIIPGNLVVARHVLLNREADDNHGYYTFMRPRDGSGPRVITTESHSLDAEFGNFCSGYSDQCVPLANLQYSDRRLKNVGESYTAGLEELNKLEFFHYTFKNDKNKTPHVGVIAQDLEKVFPNAVTKDEKGFLRIRLEDMFYAAINAIKELNQKIVDICKHNEATDNKIADMQSVIDKQNEQISDQQKQIAEQKEQNTAQEKQIADLVSRIEKLEKQQRKVK